MCQFLNILTHDNCYELYPFEILILKFKKMEKLNLMIYKVRKYCINSVQLQIVHHCTICELYVYYAVCACYTDHLLYPCTFHDLCNCVLSAYSSYLLGNRYICYKPHYIYHTVSTNSQRYHTYHTIITPHHYQPLYHLKVIKTVKVYCFLYCQLYVWII